MRPRGERLNPAFALQLHTASTAGVMVWGVIAYNTRSPPGIDPWHHPATAPRSHFSIRHCSASHGKSVSRLSPRCYYPSLACQSPDFSPIEHVWDHLERRVVHPTSLNDLEARLQQIWNEMSQDVIQNLYVLMPDRIASCIRARGSSTGH
ncbi:uncharacterized protein TNCV_4190311 [Trichonephila clavipes]|nr:uncharacterized protein TNCV_4190311 [Trichonephila clavipes]